MKEFEYSRGCGGIRIDKCLVDRTKITVPIELVTAIGAHAFDNCIRLENIVIPKSVTMIGFGAFDGCRSLRRVVVENPNLQLDKQSVFFNCNPKLEIIGQ